MHIESAPSNLREILLRKRNDGFSIGFVPTMGALHAGHMELVQKSKQGNDITVVSIFVNPIQFNNKEDLDKYPRTIEEDIEKLKSLEVDYLFNPDSKDLYPTKPVIGLDFGSMASVMEGKYRPGHFDGVGIVVSKLLNIVQPNVAYFGLKDLQQYLLIKRMCFDLNFPVQIVGVETVRESSGLALSSRNQRLSDQGLQIAANINKGLDMLKEGVLDNQDLNVILNEASKFYESINGLEIEYLEAVNAESLENVTSYDKINELAVCVAGYVEGVRLIDNLYLRLK